jgi:hypothetical protein
MLDTASDEVWATVDLATLLRRLCDAAPSAPMVADGAGGALDRSPFWRLACGVPHTVAAAPGPAFGLLPPHGAAGQASLAGALLAARPFALLDPPA